MVVKSTTSDQIRRFIFTKISYTFRSTTPDNNIIHVPNMWPHSLRPWNSAKKQNAKASCERFVFLGAEAAVHTKIVPSGGCDSRHRRQGSCVFFDFLLYVSFTYLLTYLLTCLLIFLVCFFAFFLASFLSYLFCLLLSFLFLSSIATTHIICSFYHFGGFYKFT